MTVGPETSMNSDERFIALVSRHQLPLTAFLRTLLRSQSDVDDVLQETNLVLWRKRSEYDPDRPFAPWACRIAHLQALSFFKTRRLKSHLSLNEPLLEELAQSAVQHLEHLDRRAEELNRCVDKLPGHQQKILRFRYQKNMTVQEMAENQGRTPQAMVMILYRLRHLLKECVERALRAEGVLG